MQKYNIIYADPPWEYKDKALAGNRGAGCKYKTMKIKDIQALPVQNMAASNCVLFIWVTWPHLQNGINTLEAWGFVWVKKNKKTDSLFWGMGNWTRSNSEFCLIGVRGKPKRISSSVHSVVVEPIGKHSEKPNEVRQRIVKLIGNKPRIELFAREKFKGWHVWGNEVESSIDIEDYE